MPFDFHDFDRIKNLAEELRELRYRNLRNIPSFRFWEDSDRESRVCAKEVGPGFSFRGWDKYYWLTAEAEIPEAFCGEEVLGLFDFGAPSGTGNNGNFESLLYINDVPYQAVDGNHREVFFGPGVCGKKLQLKFRLWTGLSGGGIPKDNVMEICRAQIGVLDRSADDLYYLTTAALETYEALSAENEYREWILNVLVKAFCLVDFTEPGSREFYESVSDAAGYLDECLDGRGKPDVHVTMAGHTHIDVAWLWRLCHTREKAARSFSTVNRLMEKYPEYHFLQSQPQLYEFIKEDHPDIYENIKKRVAEGRWEPSGAMWVECDCNIASGESIIRQILVGKNFFRKEFGYESEFLWLPDVFGYSWALPQILKKSGVDTFMTTKISWNDTNRLPYDTFTWKGIDGTGVTAHFVTTSDPGEDYYTYNGNSGPRAVKSVWDNYKNKDSNRELLISYGYGDGGGGPNRDMIRQIEMVEKMPGIPYVRKQSVTEYFRSLNETLKENPMEGYLPVWDGELYLEFHRGTYTSQAYNKRMNRRMDYALRDTEIRSVLSRVFGSVPYDSQRILRAWKIVLCQQFHDILPGSSIREVYLDSHTEYEKAAALLREVNETARAGLIRECREERVFSVFNSGNWQRTSVVRIPRREAESVCVGEYGKGGFYQKREDGSEEKISLPCVWKEDGAYVLVRDMEPFSYTEIVWGPAKKSVSGPHEEPAWGSGEERSLQTEKAADQRITENTACSRQQESNGGIHEVSTLFYKICWNEQGQLTKIYDREAEREMLPHGACANVLQIFEDKPRCFDAWELEPTIDRKMEEITQCTDIRVWRHALGIEVSFTWQYHKSTICQTMCLYNSRKRIDFKTSVDWQERQKLLKAAFPVDIRAVDARFDIQDGNIRRPITRNTSWEAAKFEVAAHKWADIWETGYGAALLNDCKYGYDLKENTIRLTLLKSATDPDYSADLGSHTFTYSLLPHCEEWYDAGIEQEAFDLNAPLRAEAGAAALHGSLLSFDRENLVADALKQAENGEEIVLRFHEFQGRRGEVKVCPGFEVKEWCECNLMEEPESTWRSSGIRVFLKPYEIKTLLLRVENGQRMKGGGIAL